MNVQAEHLNKQPTLADLLQGFADAPAIPVSGIASDSRLLAAGDLFLACGGENSHGSDFIEDAISAGVCAIAWDSATAPPPSVDADIPLIPVAGLGEQLGEISSRFYGCPSETLHVIGVTGTNGKTTVAWLIAQCLERLGRSCGYIGTLGSGVGEIDGSDGMTTPTAVEVHGLFAGFHDQGATYAAIEVSSHALAQNRVDGVHFGTVLFTNLSRDHLDYHSDMSSYAETKARLFLDCNPEHRIINLDSGFGSELAARCGQNVITVSTNIDRVTNGRRYVFVRSVVANEHGSHISVRSSWGDTDLLLPLPGDFNVANAVIVLALLLDQGVALEEASAALSAVSAPPGRMQRVASSADLPAVYVDYAHTPDAIEAALRALRTHCKGNLWCVFGCGGDRDAGKRPQMGHAAERLADHVVITNDNPRSESVDAIILDIVNGMSNADAATIIEDRAAAIAWTIAAAAPTDVVLIAGKGHEDYQLIGDQSRDFSDFAAASANLAVRAAKTDVSE